MTNIQTTRIQSGTLPITLTIVLLAGIAVLAGCERAEQTTAEQSIDLAQNQTSVVQLGEVARPLGHVIEVDGFTLRANVSRSDLLLDTMAQQYGIEPKPDRFLLNLVILENRTDQPASVSAEVSARHESLVGHPEAIEMRAAEANGYVSYIGTLDVGAQRVVRLFIEAQPEGTDQPLLMDFEVRLEPFDVADKQ